MFFRNLKPYQLDEGWSYSAAALGDLLSAKPWTPCGSADAVSIGFIPSINEGEFVVSAGQQQLIALGIETRLIPGAVVRQAAAERAAALEQEQGYRPGRQQMREIREAAFAELLPRAFTRRSTIHAWIDPVGRWLGIDTSSHAKADMFIEHFKVALDELPLLPFKPALAPTSAMTGWLLADEAPGTFTIGTDSTFTAQGGATRAVKYDKSVDLSGEAKRQIEQGFKVTRLDLTWNDRISFSLTEDLLIKRLAFLDLLREQAVQDAEEGQAQYRAELAIMGGELSRMLTELMTALGGEGDAS